MAFRIVFSLYASKAQECRTARRRYCTEKRRTETTSMIWITADSNIRTSVSALQLGGRPLVATTGDGPRHIPARPPCWRSCVDRGLAESRIIAGGGHGRREHSCIV